MNREPTAVDILTVGEAMALMVADDVGPLATTDRMRLRVGGSELNVAIAAARLGASTAWVSRLGDDGLGDRVERTARGEGVHVVAPRDPLRSTGVMVKERRTGDHTRVSYYRAGSAAAFMSSNDVPAELLAHSRLLHVTGITPALSSTACRAVRDLVERAHAGGVTVSLDVNFRSALWSAEKASVEIRALLPRVDILFGGLAELAILDSGIESAESAWDRLSACGLAQVVVKEGPEGASAVTANELVRHAAYPVQVVDTVGAGDAFVAGYLTAWLDDQALEGCLDRGTRAGALACTVLGDWEGAPTRAELSILDAVDPVSR